MLQALEFSSSSLSTTQPYSDLPVERKTEQNDINNERQESFQCNFDNELTSPTSEVMMT